MNGNGVCSMFFYFTVVKNEEEYKLRNIEKVPWFNIIIIMIMKIFNTCRIIQKRKSDAWFVSEEHLYQFSRYQMFESL